ncbi:ATP-binding protein [Streptomyces cyslabdanicus]|uniref:ATP-binding protein n=1 Tax=Streptomyces cyslabdanicus TaxID=1470456 RepID=UPI004044A755
MSGCTNRKWAKLLFQILTEREERKGTAVASNAAFLEWGKIFTAPRLCAATADRLTFKGMPIQTCTDSHRPKVTESEHQSSGRS